MARPVTREVVLKSGFYIEVRRSGMARGVMIRRETHDQMMMAFDRYEKGPLYNVKMVGEVKNGKVVHK
jgi:hypothetical protein